MFDQQGQPGRRDLVTGAARVRGMRPRVACVAIAAAALAAHAGVARAQVFRLEMPDAVTDDGSVRLQPANDRDAESWLRRAEDAASRGDWKLACDTLERVIEQHGDRTVTIDETSYYSVTRLVERQIREWPEEGLAAYRLLNDPEVQRLFERGRDEFDWEALRQIARKYPMSTPAPAAMDLLASRLLDCGAASEAVSLLKHLQELPHSQVPRWSIQQRLFLAFALTDQRDRASDALQELRKLSPQSDPALPADWPTRLERLQRYFEQLKLDAPALVAAPTVWPSRFGPPEQMGRMSGISHLADTMSAARLDGAESKLRTKMLEMSRSKVRPAVWQAVSDGERLFVSTPEGVVARDLLSFDMDWKAVLKRRLQPRVTNNSQRAAILNAIRGNQFDVIEEEPQRGLDPRIVQTLFHEYRGEISTAAGLVFAIEQDAPVDEQPPTTEGIVPTNDQIGDEDIGAANTLRAYEAATGRAVWARGAAGPPADELRHAHFRAAPVMAGGYLVAPFSQGGDLYLAVFQIDGSLVRKVLLGSGRASLFPLNGVLPLLVHDGTIFVQSGAGMVFALNEHDFSLKWLQAYERSGIGGASRQERMWGGPSSLPQPDEWLSSPPVVSGGLVIVAPHDSENLHAFDLTDGRAVWTQPRQTHRYIVGATPSYVFLAGDRVGALEARSGRDLWMTDALYPTGRCVISGDQVLVPSGRRLIRLNMATGELIDDSTVEQALGNLLVFEGSLYSLGPDRLNKILDPVHSAELARARLERNPSDVEAILLLALLSEIRDEHAEAMALLSRAERCIASMRSEAAAVGDANRSESADALETAVVHRRVATLLSMAAAAEEDARLPHLQEAVRIARRPGDVAKAAVQLCDELIALGRAPEAFRVGLDLFARSGVRLVDAADDRHLSVRSDVQIGASLAAIWAELDEAGRQASAQVVADLLAARPAADRAATTERVSDVLGFLPDAAARDLAQGRAAWLEDRQESAIFFFERAHRRAADRDTAAVALACLAAAHRYPGPGLVPSLSRAAEAGRRLAAEYADVRLSGPAAEMATDARLTARGSMADYAESLRATLPAGLWSEQPPFPSILDNAKRLALGYELAIPGNAPGGTASLWTAGRDRELFSGILPVQLARQIVALRSTPEANHEYLWTADIHSEADLDEVADPLIGSSIYPCAISGSVIAAHADTGLFALGLASGRLMWSEFDREETVEQLPAPAVVAVNGIIVAATHGNTLVAWHARDSAQRLWRRVWPTLQIRSLRAAGDCVLAIDRNATRAILIDPENGRIRREFSILTGELPGDPDTDELEATDTDAHAAVVGGVICRSGHRNVIGRDVATGRVLWTVELSGGVSGLYELDDQHIGIAYKPNRFRVILARGGSTVLEPDMDGLSPVPEDAVVVTPTRGDAAGAPRLLLFVRTDDLPPEYALVSYPLSGGGQSGRRLLGPSATISPGMMRSSPDFVPVIQNEVRQHDAARAFDDRRVSVDPQVAPRLVFVSTANCERLRLRWYEFDEGRLGTSYHRSRLITDVWVFDDCVVALAPEGVYILVAHDEKEADAQ